MTRVLVCLIATLVLLLAVSPLAAQEDTYIVQKGDNLWKLAGAHLDSPLLWEQIYKDNPFLQEPGRRFQKDGIVYVMIRPGEKLIGLEKLGIIATITPIERLQLPQKTAVYEVPTTPAWVWWPLALAIALLIAAWLIYRMLTRDPVNSRPAVVPGGVTAETATARFQEMAGQQYYNRTGNATRPQDFTILKQVAGRIWGVLNVRYADGREIPRRLSGDRAFRARVRFPNGSEETLYMLQGCGNDLRYGGISRYLPGPEFRFEADPAPVPTETPAPVTQPTAEPAPAETQAPATQAVAAHGGQGGSGYGEVPSPAPATPTPAPVAQATPSNINEYGELVRTKDAPTARIGLTFEMKRSGNGEPHLVRFDSDQVEEFFIGRDRRITIRYREPEDESTISSK